MKFENVILITYWYIWEMSMRSDICKCYIDILLVHMKNELGVNKIYKWYVDIVLVYMENQTMWKRKVPKYG